MLESVWHINMGVIKRWGSKGETATTQEARVLGDSHIFIGAEDRAPGE